MRGQFSALTKCPLLFWKVLNRRALRWLCEINRQRNTARKFITRARRAEAPARRRLARERSRGDASDIIGQTERSNRAFGKSDIEGKTVTGSGERAGKRTSFK